MHCIAHEYGNFEGNIINIYAPHILKVINLHFLVTNSKPNFSAAKLKMSLRAAALDDGTGTAYRKGTEDTIRCQNKYLTMKKLTIKETIIQREPMYVLCMCIS